MLQFSALGQLRCSRNQSIRFISSGDIFFASTQQQLRQLTIRLSSQNIDFGSECWCKKITLYMNIYENQYLVLSIPHMTFTNPKILKFGTFHFGFGLRPKAKVFKTFSFGYSWRWKGPSFPPLIGTVANKKTPHYMATFDWEIWALKDLPHPYPLGSK